MPKSVRRKASHDSSEYRSTNQGATWMVAHSVKPTALVRDIAYSPEYNNDDTLFLAADSSTEGVYRSNDRGDSWKLVGGGPTSYAHALIASPAYITDTTIFAGTALGVFWSQDGGVRWPLDPIGLSGKNVLSLAISPDYYTDGVILAGVQDEGVYGSADGGSTWDLWSTGIPAASVTALAVSPDFGSDETMYAAVESNGVYRSTNGGQNWEPMNTGLGDHYVLCLDLDPTGQYLFAGTKYSGLWVKDTTIDPPTPTPTFTPEPTATNTPAPTATFTPTAEPTATNTPEPTPTFTPEVFYISLPLLWK